MGSREPPKRNIELKARDDDPERSLATCLRLRADDRGPLCQRDTYFHVAIGGLKLREEKPGFPHLIQFVRADEPQQRESRYRLIPVHDAAVLRAALADALGVSQIVRKVRHLFLWEGVRIHLDDVEGLGTFIELEAVVAEPSDTARAHQLVEELRAAFSIEDERLVPIGYASLLGSGAKQEPA